MTDPYLLKHTGHDCKTVIERWKALVSGTGASIEILYGEGEDAVYVIQTELARTGNEEGIYISAGVHGDECAPVNALLEWVENDPELLVKQNLTLFPCLNPFGLRENTRRDKDGVDLNRNFQNREVPLIRAWQDWMADRRFSIAVNLHEDYDSNGIYIYELSDDEGPAERLLSACEDVIPREMNPEVDGSPFENGIMVRKGNLREVVEEDLDGGFPEAIYLKLHHVDCALTFESPSEFSLTDRVAVHRRFLEEIVRLQNPD